MMINDVKPTSYLTGSSDEPWIENVGETLCLEPSLKKSSNHDDKNSSKPCIF